jgi:uncharacterized protein (DUF433 family)
LEFPLPRVQFKLVQVPAFENGCDPQVMGGRPCVHGLRVTAGTITGLVATGHTRAEIRKLYPHLEEEDINQALKYAAWRAEEVELPLQPAGDCCWTRATKD